MSWKKKKIIQNIAFILFIALLLFTPLGTFLLVQLNRLLPKDHYSIRTKQISTTNGN
jgi:hypothetical protein